MTFNPRLAFSLFPALLLAQSPLAAQVPQLNLEQQTALKCSAAFAIVADGQARGNAEAQAWPAMADRGREFFVRSSARIMDETGMNRDQISAALSAEAQKLWDEGTIERVMPGCLMLLDASGI
ncbi:hypothetical protein [Erythrobacter sp. HKB08]|uniref:hypothetical protein n=1 Tax=Erythrobacter sp. HKB08 TaxID=2502843 RepID=UPI0010091A53|nr:hypothetical protein [Erythrobacter sp. HKB08]